MKPMVSVLFMASESPPPSLTLRVGQKSPDALKPITVWEENTTCPESPVHNGRDNLTCFLNFKSTWSNDFQRPQLSITTEGKHQNPVTVIVPRAEYDTPGNINDQTIPRHQTSFLVYGPLWSVRVVASVWK